MDRTSRNPYYPVFLDLRGRRCVIIGAGEIAERKVQQVLACEGNATFISPEASASIRELAEANAVEWLARPYASGDLTGAFLAIAATDDTEVNQQVHAEAEAKGILLNVVDIPELCSFIAPAVVERGPVKVAISTGGASPALARKLRESLEGYDPLAWADAAKALAEVREELKQGGSQASPDAWQLAMDTQLLALVQAGDHEGAKARLRESLKEGAVPSRE
ncbi:MAG: bifunctional precorrin-2 dehydrogenase/sirohydrochlorin ferrochelatase [Chloroflexi bacterium]|nr:bifunctional precorrin-2 dehydrogenase/sirohydrochlorin ferrochelatase [Chloroflexota bacterium]